MILEVSVLNMVANTHNVIHTHTHTHTHTQSTNTISTKDNKIDWMKQFK